MSLDCKIYFIPETPCRRGHMSKRRTIGKVCVECENLRKANNKQRYDGYKANWRENNREATRLASKSWYESNKEQKKQYYSENKDSIKERIKNLPSDRKLALKKQRRFYNSGRKQLVELATPNWANKNSIKEIYFACPKDFTVDHEIPLKGKLVCGLHVENNLQYLSHEDNSSKSNKFIPYIESNNFRQEILL